MDLTGDDALCLRRRRRTWGSRPRPAAGSGICAGPRIGVDYAQEAKDFPWRFWLEKEDVSHVFL